MELWITTPERLASKFRELIMDGQNEVFLSAAGGWEIAIKYAIGKLALPEEAEKFVPSRLMRDAIMPLPIHHTHVFVWAPSHCITAIPLIVFSYHRYKWSICQS